MITIEKLPEGTNPTLLKIANKRIELFLSAGEEIEPLDAADRKDFHTLLTLLYAQALTDVEALKAGVEPDEKPQLLLAALDLLNDD